MAKQKTTVDVPVAFLIFNRPKKTKQVLERISEAEPPELYIVADGPRDSVPGDQERCTRTREVVQNIGWECEVHRNYADENLGCFERIWTGIEWVFNSADKAIILEDDCLPHPDFFRFCETMLSRFENDERVMDIAGSNPLETWKPEQQDYHFSYTGMLWGWATWADQWDKYDPEMSLWADEEARQRVRDVISDQDIWRYAKRVYDQTYRGEKDTWDYQWGFTRHINSGLSVIPSKNLVKNIGYGEDSTHTDDENNPKANVPVYSLSFPVRKRSTIAVDREYDRAYHELRRSVWDTYLPLRLIRDVYNGIFQHRGDSLFTRLQSSSRGRD